MLDINLLNKKGIYNTKNLNFNDIDEELKSLNEDFSDSINDDSKDSDNHCNDKNQSIKNGSGGKSLIYLFLLIGVFAIGFWSYQKFFNNNMQLISSKDINQLISYVLKNDQIIIDRIKINNRNIDMTFNINQETFDDYKVELNKYFEKIDKENIFNYTLSNEKLNVSSSSEVLISNDSFDESKKVQDFESDEIIDIDKISLKLILDSIFNINNQNLINFDIISTEDTYPYYNIIFIK